MSARNAEPEKVFLAVLDVCERTARRIPVDWEDDTDQDVRFMKDSFENLQSRIKMLKEQAAAAWTPEFKSMLSSAHSISIAPISYTEKEGVRTQKMKCMACGRWEKRCKYGLNAVGPFDVNEFHCQPAEGLVTVFHKFHREYKTILHEDANGSLLKTDMGMYSIGETCMKKAEIFFQLNTLILNETFEAFYRADGEDLEEDEWCYATSDQAEKLLKTLQSLQACAADHTRAAPEYGTDEQLWKHIRTTRQAAARGNSDELAKLLRARAGSFVQLPLSDDEDSDEEMTMKPPQRRKAKETIELSSSDDDDEDRMSQFIVEDDEDDPPPKKGKRAAQPRRKSRRINGDSPEKTGECAAASEPGVHEPRGPREEGLSEDDEHDERGQHGQQDWQSETSPPATRRSRAPGPSACEIAQARRAPGTEGRLPARRECLAQLAELQLKMIREDRSGDAAVCTSALMTLQELMSRVDKLAHTF